MKFLTPQKILFLLACFCFLYALPAQASTINIPRAINNLGLVNYWTFDGKDTNWGTNKTNDIVSAKNGTITNGGTTTTPVPGKIGQALLGNSQTTNTGTFINLASTNSYFTNIFNNDFSISVWANSATTTGSDGLRWVFDVGGFQNTGTGIAFNIDNNPWSTRSIGLYYGLASVKSLATWNPNTWYHIVETRSGTILSLYVNGVFQASTTAAGITFASDDPKFMSQSNNGLTPRRAFNGKIDEARVYNRALSATEVSRLYTSNSAKINISQNNKSTSGLVGLWSLDGQDLTDKVYDRSGSGNNGYIFNVATSSAVQPGKIGQALIFDGVNDYVNLGSSVPNTTRVTVSAWVKLSNTTGGMVVCRDNSTRMWQLLISSQKVAWTVFYGAGTPSGATGATTLAVGKWYHIVGVHDGSNAVVYVNGAQDGTAAASGNLVTGSDFAYIGARLSPAVNVPFNGVVDDVRIYNRALTAAEVKQLYILGGEKIQAPQTEKLTSGLTSHYSFDGVATNWNTNKTSDIYGSRTASLSLFSTTTSSVPGRVGQALLFNGSTQFIDPGLVAGNYNTGSLSVSLWAKPSTITVGTPFGTSNFGSNRLYMLMTSGVWQIGIDSTGNISTGFSADLNTWQHLVLVMNGTTATLYKNGVASASPFSYSTFTTPASLPLIGDLNTAGGNKFTGVIDDVRIYNRPLTQAEITRLYNMGK